jgi:hypothetical protein
MRKTHTHQQVDMQLVQPIWNWNLQDLLIIDEMNPRMHTLQVAKMMYIIHSQVVNEAMMHMR